MIMEYSIGKIKAFSENDIPAEHVLVGFVILKQSLRMIVSLLMDFPLGINNVDLAENIGMPKNSVAYSLQKLEKIDLIFSEKDGKQKKYYIKKELVSFTKMALQKFETIKC